MRATCDYLNVTTPIGESPFVRDELKLVLEEAAGYESLPGLWRLDTGTVKFYTRGQVGIASFSGGALAALRAAQLFNRALSSFAGAPHRVTQLDAFVDVWVCGSSIVPDLYRRTKDVGVNLTRKRVKPHVLLAPDADGNDSGTCYFGHRGNAEVSARVYDKQLERVSKHYPDPGPITRYELTFRSGVGCTLRDAADPTAVFWHHASPDLLPAPANAPAWSPHSEGFVSTPRQIFSPYDRVKRILENSADVERALDVALSADDGDRIVAMVLQSMLSRRRKALAVVEAAVAS